VPDATQQSTSTIADMHMQNGMKSIKQDLQKKIQNYQNILKKTSLKHAAGATSTI